MINREYYMQKLRAFRNKPLIKVLTGLRRSGKSSLLLLLQEELLAENVQPGQIIYINFDNMDFFDLRSAQSLHTHLNGKMAGMDF